MIQFDSKILAGKKPMTVFDTEEAEQFKGKEGYFSNSPTDFEDLTRCTKNTLVDVNHAASNVDGLNFHFCAGSKLVAFKYFLPAEWVSDVKPEPEPEWVPYDIDTFKMDGYITGQLVTFRRKSWADDAVIQTVMYLGYRESVENLDDVQILLGNEWFSFQQLFGDYEMFDAKYDEHSNREWRPFGYQE